MSTKAKPKTTTNAGNKNQNPRKNNGKQSNKQVKKPVVKNSQEEEGSSSSEEEDGELCFICTEPIKTFAVAQCDHRTCHKCSLRLRALYDTRNCAYCKVSKQMNWLCSTDVKILYNRPSKKLLFSQKMPRNPLRITM